MKVEKINDNKARIILTLDELKKRKITPKDIEEGKGKVQDFFFEILEDSQLADDFKYDSSGLLVEVSSSNNNLFMITLTKSDIISDLDTIASSKQSFRNFAYTVSSNFYRFDSIESLYLFCKKAHEENLYIGTNSLYKLNTNYFLYFTKNTIKNPNFVKTFSVISEYANKYYSSNSFKLLFYEYSKLLICKNAINTIQTFE